MELFEIFAPLSLGGMASLTIFSLVGWLFYRRKKCQQMGLSSEFRFVSRLFILSLVTLSVVVIGIAIDSVFLYQSIDGIRLEHLGDSERILASYYLEQVWEHMEQINKESNILIFLLLPGLTAVIVGMIVLLYGRNLLMKILQERAFNQDILDAIADPIFVKGGDYEWRGGNKAFWHLVNSDAKQLIGSRDDSICSDASKELVRQWESSVVESNVTNSNEEVFSVSDENDMHAIVIRSPLKMPDGDRGLVGVIHNITHLKEVEKELADHRDNLEKRVAEQTETLKAALKEAEAVSDLKSDFLANMSHELRTPLNSIIGMASLLLEDDLSSEQHEMMATLETASKNLLDIVNDILDLSKIESGVLELEHIAFDAQSVITKVTNILAPLASRKGLALTWHGKGLAPVFVIGDPLRYERVITNLVSNAIKYTDAGEVDIFFDVMSAGDGQRMLKIAVQDTGIGMTDEMLDRMFDKFTQADTSTTRKYGGSGLGLAITKQLIDKMHGSIAVESEKGKGSTFTVRIPFEICDGIAKVEEQEVALNQCGIIPPSKVRILIAEDHPLNQVFVRKLLTSVGIDNIRIVENGEDALQVVTDDEYDIVLMDCHMPKMNGYDATKAIRQMGGAYQHLPIIAMTANAMHGERERCLDVGMDDYISKPVDKKLLVNILSNWINFGDLVESLTKEPVAEEEEILPVLDLVSIRTFSGDDKELEREFADIFIQQSLKQLEELSQNIVDGQSQSWVETAHMLKGGAATMGAMQMRALAANAQGMFSDSFANREAIYDRMNQAFAEVKQEIDAQIFNADTKVAGGAGR